MRPTLFSRENREGLIKVQRARCTTGMLTGTPQVLLPSPPLYLFSPPLALATGGHPPRAFSPSPMRSNVSRNVSRELSRCREESPLLNSVPSHSPWRGWQQRCFILSSCMVAAHILPPLLFAAVVLPPLLVTALRPVQLRFSHRWRVVYHLCTESKNARSFLTQVTALPHLPVARADSTRRRMASFTSRVGK